MIIYCLLLYSFRIYYIFHGFFSKYKTSKTAARYSKFAILIPARNESKVIENSLKSLKKQTYPKSKYDVFVIVEDEVDPTIEITKQYGYNIFIRPDLENKRTKGWALDQCVKNLLQKEYECDAVVILDADNIVSENYLEKLNNYRQESRCVLGLGNRQATNPNASRISLCSSLTLVLLSIFGSKGKSKAYDKVILCGTGFYLDYQVLKEEKGFIWHGLCEDNELCLYTYEKDLKCGYVEDAIFYDEQPQDYKTNLLQHTRWIYGILQSNALMKSKIAKSNKLYPTRAKKDYLNSNFSLVVLVLFWIIDLIFHLFYGVSMYAIEGENKYLIIAIILFLGGYLLFTLLATMVFIYNRQHYRKIGLWKKISCGLSYFFYLCDFLFSFLYGLKKKNREWKVIAHLGTID